MITEAFVGVPMIQESGVALARELRQHNRLQEATIELFDKLVNYDDELFDGSGRQVWSKISLQDFSQGAASLAYRDEGGLDTIRNHARYLGLENEFAINAHENRISYIVGQGHVYSVKAKADIEVDPAELDQVKAVIDDFIRVNHWQRRQQEIVRRYDRDGECFLRFFTSTDGTLLVRFVEPERVRTPDANADTAIRFGIRFDSDDAETALGYYVRKSADDQNGEPINATEIQHRKANVDCTSPRGLPLLYPVRKNLGRAEKLLTGIGNLATFRSMIAMIRKHTQGSSQKIQDFVDGRADVQTQNSSTGATRNFTQYRPGTILDHGPATEYEFPSHQTDIVSFVGGLQAELRAIASRLVMPEFMLSSDASNANYASTMVAEGPSVKMFERCQADMIQDDKEVMIRAIASAAAAGKVAEDVLDRVDIEAEPPQVRTRDRLKEAQADAVLSNGGVLSKKTFAARHGLDYEAERENMDSEHEEDGGLGGGLDLGAEPGEEGGDDSEDQDEK